MPFASSPKALVRDVADGFFDLNPAILKKFTSAELKVVHSNLSLILREVRNEAANDIPSIRKRSLRIQRLNQALFVLETYCRRHRITLV